MSVFVTVGTTSFDELTSLITSQPILELLHSKGFTSLLVQFGRGRHEVSGFSTSGGFKVEGYRYKNSISEDIQEASLVISHAGAGTCLEVLEAGKLLLVVVNEKLMNNHQIELAEQLHKDGHLLYCTCKNLESTLKELNASALKPFPPPKTKEFGQDFTEHFQMLKS